MPLLKDFQPQRRHCSGALKMGTENELKMTAVMKKINSLVHRVFPDERFVTLFYMELYNDLKGLCLYVNAGHNPPIHLNYATNSMEVLDATGPVLGPSLTRITIQTHFTSIKMMLWCYIQMA